MASSLRRLMQGLLVALPVLVLVGLGFVATGQAAFVTTDGVSMNPVYYEGDLVVIASASDYEVGQIVAYERPGRSGVVLHRIIGGDAGGYVFKGDNNSSVDPTEPTVRQLVGRAVLHIPNGGTLLDRLTNPSLLGLLAFGLMAGGGTAVRNRRTRRKRAMSQHVHRTRPAATLGTLPPTLSMVAALAALVGVLGAGLGAFAWTGSTLRTVTEETPSEQGVTFSYTAQVPRSAAYDGTTVRSPDPVFRALADSVDVSYLYRGAPGSVRVVAELSTTSGWHSTVPLTDKTEFDGDSYEGTISLDLPALERRAQEAADVIGVPSDQVVMTLSPHFVTDSGATFAPELPLTLSTTQLALADASALSVTDPGTVQTTTTAPRTLELGGHEISVAAARTLSIVLLALALLGAALVAGLARRGAPGSEGAAIRRRHAKILVRVEPMPSPTGRPVIDVSEFSTLVKLAERYGLLVLHWSRSNVDTFVVQDESATYRYRAATELTAAVEDNDSEARGDESHPDDVSPGASR